MNTQNNISVEEKLNDKYKKRDKKKSKKMKVSGSRIKNLQKIISQK